MNLQWKNLPTRIQERLEESLRINVREMNDDELSFFMKGSVQMNYEWNNRERVKDVIFESLYDGKVSSGRQL
jgi:hypothetical protein